MQDPVNDSNTPRYRLLAPCFLDDTLYDEGTEIYWTACPNEEMEPLNELARDASQKYMEMLDDAGRAVAAARNRAFTGRRDMLDQAIDHSRIESLDHGRVALPTSREDVPIRSDLANPAQRAAAKRAKPSRVLGAKPPTKAPKKGGPGQPIVLGPQVNDPSTL